MSTTPKLEHKEQTPFTVNDRGEITMLVASFLNIDRGREIIVPGAYAKHLQNFASRGRVFLDHNHTAEEKVGRVIFAQETTEGLQAKAVFSGDSKGQWARDKAREGVLRDLSVGHYVYAEKLADKNEVLALWKQYSYTPTPEDLFQLERGPIRLILEAEASEVSFVGLPMNENARVLEVKRGAVFNKVNYASLKEVYRLIKSLLSSVESEEEATNGQADAPAPKASAQEAPKQEAPLDHAAQTETPETKHDKIASVSAVSRLKVELELLDLETA